MRDAIVVAARARLKGAVYADWAAAALPLPESDSVDEFIPPPHSNTLHIQDARLSLLSFLGSNETDFAVVFTSGASAALELISRRLPWRHGDHFVCHVHAHNALLGIRNPATAAGASFRSVNSDDMSSLFTGEKTVHDKRIDDRLPFALLAFPGECNLTGARYPLQWADDVRAFGVSGFPASRVVTLVDGAKLAASAPVALRDHPGIDLFVFSLYKLCGSPTGIGALLIRRGSLAEELLMSTADKSFFGGGMSVQALTPRSLLMFRPALDIIGQLEVGTPHYLGIARIPSLLSRIKAMGGMQFVRNQGATVAQRFRASLRKHFPLSTIHEDCSEGVISETSTVSFTLVTQGVTVGHHKVAGALSKHKVYLRAGCMCNAGACAQVLGLSDYELSEQFNSGRVCNDETEFVDGVPTGVVRASFGWGSVEADADAIIRALQQEFGRPTPMSKQGSSVVMALYIYPVKSCKGQLVHTLHVSEDGARGDRMFVVVHKGSREKVSPTRYPRLASLSASIDVSRSTLLLSVADRADGNIKQQRSVEIAVPNMSAIGNAETLPPDGVIGNDQGNDSGKQGRKDTEYVACGGSVVSDFLTDVVGIPCELMYTTRSACKRKGTLLAISSEQVRRVAEVSKEERQTVIAAARANIVFDELSNVWQRDMLCKDMKQLQILGDCTRCSAVNTASHAEGGGDVLYAMQRADGAYANSSRRIFGQIVRARDAFDITLDEVWCTERSSNMSQ